MNTLTFSVNGNRLTRLSGYDPVSGEKNYSIMRFEFDEEWEGVTDVSIYMFFDVANTKIVTAEITNNVAKAYIHPDLRNQSGKLWVGVTGVKSGSEGDSVIDTCIVPVPVGKGIHLDGNESTSLFQQLMEHIATMCTRIADGAVTSEKIASGAVTGEKIAERTIQANNINQFAVGNIHLVPRCVTSDKIGFNEVAGENIADGAVTSDKISRYAVLRDKIAGGAIDSSKLSDGAIDDLRLFSDEFISEYLHLPLVKRTTSGAFGESYYNTLTVPGIYQLDSNTGTHQVVIVLRPHSDSHLMQIRMSYDKLEYRGIWCSTEGVYADEDWEPWRELGGLAHTVDTENIADGAVTSEKLSLEYRDIKYVTAANGGDDGDHAMLSMVGKNTSSVFTGGATHPYYCVNFHNDATNYDFQVRIKFDDDDYGTLIPIMRIETRRLYEYEETHEVVASDWELLPAEGVLKEGSVGYSLLSADVIRDINHNDPTKPTLPLSQIDAIGNLFKLAAYSDDNAQAAYLNYIKEFRLNKYQTLRELSGEDFTEGRGLGNTAPSYSISNDRTSYLDFDIPAEKGYLYRIDYTCVNPDAQICVEFYTKAALDKVSAEESYDQNSSYKIDGFGWQDTGHEWDLYTPVAGKDYTNIAGMRVSFNSAAAGVNSVKISRKLGGYDDL